jgi:hypothetical protein
LVDRIFDLVDIFVVLEDFVVFVDPKPLKSGASERCKV